MRSDCDGVGGFIEDLPVLAVILSGVMLLMTTASWVNGLIVAGEESRTLEIEARAIVDRFISFMEQQSGGLPLVDSITMSKANISLIHEAGNANFALSVSELLPERLLLLSFEECDNTTMRNCAFAMGFMNAIDSSGRVAMLEVRVIAWL